MKSPSIHSLNCKNLSPPPEFKIPIIEFQYCKTLLRLLHIITSEAAPRVNPKFYTPVFIFGSKIAICSLV